ncbi:MAG TPA: conjugal transfer protein TrbL family protein [Chloroflexota bacterium]|nr:conjugal transfer protein TrbL family protein [Chloroflexota bacterium]
MQLRRLITPIRALVSPQRRVHAHVIPAFVILVVGTALLAAPSAHAAHGATSTPTPVITPTPGPSGTSPLHGSGNPLGALNPSNWLPDPKTWAADIFSQVLVTFLRSIADGLHSLVKGVMASSLNFITRTPPAGSYNSPTVHTLWNVVRGIADAALVLVALLAGFNVMARQHLGSPYHEAMEVIPRLILGALLVNTSLSWGQLAIDVNNALCEALGQTSLPAWQHADTVTQALVNVIATLIYLITSLLLVIQMLMRLALVDVLLITAPIGLLCWILPQTNSWARLWSTTFFSVVFVQFVQVVALKLGGSLMTDLTPMAADAALLSVFLGIAVLVLTLKIPSLMRHHAGEGFGFVRYLAYQQASRALSNRGGAGGTKGGA